MKISLDNGETYIEAPQGIRVIVENPHIPGEDESGELHINCTEEGMILVRATTTHKESQMEVARDKQVRHLPKSANTDPRTTHVAIRTDGVKYFCRFDPTDIGPHQGVPDDQIKGTYWITACRLYGAGYNGCSLWQGGFSFVPLEEYNG